MPEVNILSLKKIRLIALIAALITCISLYLIVSNLQKGGSIALNSKTISVVTATQNIAPYTKITSEMVSAQNITASDGIQNYFTQIGDVVGKTCKSDIYAGEVITSNRIAEEKDISLGLATQLENGMRAVTIAVDVEQGVAATIKAGNYVDVIYVNKVDGGSGDATASSYLNSAAGAKNPANSQTLYHNYGQYFAVTALQNVKVVALDNIFYKDDTKTSYQSVTLGVTPEQAAQLALMCDGEGTIRLSLRPQEDKTMISEPRGEVFENAIK